MKGGEGGEGVVDKLYWGQEEQRRVLRKRSEGDKMK